MASSDICSSPLSSLPASQGGEGTPPSSATAQLSPNRCTSIEARMPTDNTSTISAETTPVTHQNYACSSAMNITPEPRSPASSPKRAREEDDEDEIPPPKKRNTKSGPKAKPKSAAKAPTSKETTTRKATQKKPTPPPSTRPSRNRKAPDRFENLAQPPPPNATPARKGSSKVFDPTYITTNSTSRLGKADVYHMLLEPAAWTSLTADQQKELVAMLPDSVANKGFLEKIENGETEGTRPNAFTISNDCFRTDVAKFKEDLKNGHLAKTWQAAAHQAVVARAAGEYDEWKAQEAELWWGQKADPEV